MGPDGIYRWRSPVQLDSDPEGFRLLLVVSLIVCVLSIGICAVISIDFMFSILPVILGSVAAAGLLLFLVGKLSNSITQSYEMSDQYVKLGDRKTPIYYNQLSEIVVHPLYLELRENKKSTKIYAEKEDFYFVKDYILNHSMGNAVVKYDGYGTKSTLEK